MDQQRLLSSKSHQQRQGLLWNYLQVQTLDNARALPNSCSNDRNKKFGGCLRITGLAARAGLSLSLFVLEKKCGIEITSTL